MEQKKGIKILKAVATILVSTGATMAVSNAIKFTTPENLKLIKRICLGAGSLAIGGMLGEKASQYTEETIDKAGEAIRTAFSGEETEKSEENTEEEATE